MILRKDLKKMRIKGNIHGAKKMNKEKGCKESKLEEVGTFLGDLEL